MQTLISTKYQVVIPKEIRKKIGLKAGQRVNVKLFDQQIILSPILTPQKLNWPTDHLTKLKNVSKDKDIDKNLEEERNSWE